MYDVIISGYYGFDNSGDDALLMAIINDLRELKKDVSILVLSKKPEETKKNYDVDSLNRLNIIKIYKAMKKSKLFINGGGSLIQDVTSTKSLMYYLGIIKLALLSGIKVMVYANGIGPVKGKGNKKIVTRILNKVSYITLREQHSYNQLKELKVTVPPIKVTADPAVNIIGGDNDRIAEIFNIEGIQTDNNLVGFSIRDWKDNSFEDKIVKAIKFMIDNYSIKPVFIPMHYPNDLSIAERTVTKIGNGYVIKNKYSVKETIAIIEKMELMIGMRLHSLIYAVSSKVPAIGLIYDPKVEGFINYTNQHTAGNIDNITSERLIEVIEKSWINRENLRTDLIEINKELKLKAKKNAQIAIDLLRE